ncbi:MAG: ROK family protein [Arcanobacterium sp.]|nr:ROK family protein [Arcanobacterium sp.]MDY5589392.1 ROK family protein [Arcanobacterium sp.]
MGYTIDPADWTLEESVIQSLSRSAATRSELCERLDISRTSLGRALANLQKDGPFISTYYESHKEPGRPSQRLYFNPKVAYQIGIDISRTECCAIVLNRVSDILIEETLGIEHFASWTEHLQRMCTSLRERASQNRILLDFVTCIGVGIPVPVSHTQSDVSQDSEEYQTLSALLQSFWNVPVFIENTVRLGGIGESVWGAGKDASNQMYLRIGGGVACCLSILDQITGAQAGHTGELGHIHVPGNSEPCYCGKTGCIETIASLPALYKSAGVSSLAELKSAYDASDERATQTVYRAMSVIGRACGSIVLVTNPQVIICSGEIFDAIPQTLDMIRTSMRSELLPRVKYETKVVYAQLGHLASALGAAQAAHLWVRSHRHHTNRKEILI